MRETLRQHLKRYLHLLACKGRASAKMLSEPECQVMGGRPGDIELICVGAHGLVTVGRRVQQQKLSSRWQFERRSSLFVFHSHFLGGYSKKGLHGRIKTRGSPQWHS
jgi:hypothetical protein